MSSSNGSLAEKTDPARETSPWIAPLAGILVGTVCAACGGHLVGATPFPSAVFGALFGFCFWLAFGKRASSPGAGFIWGLGFASLVWLLVPAGIIPLLMGTGHSESMALGARERFPE